jgi:hypothetical protein
VRCADDLHPLRVLALFRNIPDEDLDVLDIAGVCVGGGAWRGVCVLGGECVVVGGVEVGGVLRVASVIGTLQDIAGIGGGGRDVIV